MMRSYRRVPRLHPRLALVAASLLASAAVIFYATDRAPAKPDSIRVSEAADIPEPGFDAVPEPAAPSAAAPVASEPAHRKVLAFHAPGVATGQRLDPRSAQYIKVAATGEKPVGRSAEVDPRTFADLAALHADDPI